MKITIVGRSFPFHQVGGMEVVGWDLARHLAAAGHDITVLTTTILGRPLFFIEEGIEVHALSAPSGRYSPAWTNGTRRAFYERHYESCELLVGIGAGAHAIVTDRRWLQTRVPAVMQAHGTSWAEFRSKWTRLDVRQWAKSPVNLLTAFKDWRAYRRYNEIIAVGDIVYTDIYRFPTKCLLGRIKVNVVHNGVDPALFRFSENERLAIRQKLQVSRDEFLFIYSGRLNKQKGLDHALKAFQKLACYAPNVRFVVVGDGPQRPFLEKLVSSLQISQKVSFLGGVNRSTLPGFYSSADALVLTTLRREAGIPVAILEGLASGLPCIASGRSSPDTPGIIVTNPRSKTSIIRSMQLAIETAGKDGRASLLPERFTSGYANRRYSEVITAYRRAAE